MQEIINMACLNSNTSLLHLVSYQHLLWTSEVGPGIFSDYRMIPLAQYFIGSPGVVANAQLSWFEGLWNANPETSVSYPPFLVR